MLLVKLTMYGLCRITVHFAAQYGHNEVVKLFYSILLMLYSASTEGLQQHVLQP